MSVWEIVLRLVGLIAALALVLFLAWALMRWMNKKVPGMGGGGSARLIKLLDRLPLGKNGQILLIRVQDKVLLIAVSEHNSEKLCEFDDPDGLISGPEDLQNPSFANAFKDALGKIGFTPKGERSGKQEDDS